MFSAQDLRINTGEKILLSGPSGIGKTLFGLGLIHLFPKSANIELDIHIQSDGEQSRPESPEWHEIRRSHIGFIFQQPMAYFNPALTCGDQLLEGMDSTKTIAAGKQTTIELCQRLKIKQSDKIFEYYPHQFSIGELQRLMCAMCLLRKPRLIIADEPFANMDLPLVQILKDVIDEYILENDASLLLISHDEKLVENWVNSIWIFNEQRKVVPMSNNQEGGTSDTIMHEYLPGDANHYVLSARNLVKAYDQKNITSFKIHKIKILDGINLSVSRGERIGIMGESGAGKTTLALILAGLIKPDEGTLEGIEKDNFSPGKFFRRKPSKIQVVFQDPFTSLNPSIKVGKQLRNQREKIQNCLSILKLDSGLLDRLPSELSGGELQRLCIIRALLVQPEPELLIFDEALSALDEENRMSVIKLLQKYYPDISVLYISHRFEHIQKMCNRVLFIRNGRIEVDCSVTNLNDQTLPKWVLSLCGQ